MARIDGGPADGNRVIDVAMYQGFRLRIWPDRGLDIGTAEAFGIPIGWRSKVGDAAPLPIADGNAWIERFSGGLLTTCGPDNIGVPSVDNGVALGLHGSWSFLKAADVTVDRRTIGDQYEVTISGRLEQSHALGRHLIITREIVTTTGTPVVTITDTITNAGTTDEPIPMLYHVNFGAPFWGPGSQVQYPDGTHTIPRNEYAKSRLNDADRAPIASEVNGQEFVYERVVPGDDSVGVTIVSARTGLRAQMHWTKDSLPTSHQWQHPAHGAYVLGVEPANTALSGRAAIRAEGRLPMLSAGESRVFSVRIAVERAT
jgi:hypothetical protein